MKIIGIVAALTFAFTLAAGSARADDHHKGEKPAKAAKAGAKKAAAGKAVTLTGEMACGKCGLKETDKCQNVLKVTEAGTETKYYLAKNDTSDGAHGKVCGGTAKATVTGTVAEDAGKKVLTASAVKYE